MTQLPIDEYIPKILASLTEHKNLVLVAEPGAGKTTRVPPALMKNVESPEEILVLQPRRIAARASAARMSQENGWHLGQEVGYQIRFENRTSQRTRIRIITEGILNRRLQNDPDLKGVSHVILDEFHERSLHSDLAIGLLRESQQTVREDLHILVMSATLEAEPVAGFLGDCPIVRVPGRGFPIEIRQIERSLPLPGRPEFIGAVVAEIKKAIQAPDRQPGHLLVFLPGAGEIQRCLELLEPLTHQLDLLILPLHGSLPAEAQDLALKPSAKTKVILATNIAETSLTIDGVHTVLDSGLARILNYDPNSGLERLKLGRISRASARQRAGRAGRQGPGQCLQLWTKFENAAMSDFEEPEVRRADLCETLLLLAQWGVRDPIHFNWFESPPLSALQRSRDLLMRLGALGPTGEITQLGGALLSWPLHPRLGRLMQAAVDANRFIDQAAMTAASLSERGDRQILRARDQLMGIARRTARLSDGAIVVQAQDPDEFVARAMLLAYPDRVCRLRTGSRSECRMVGGKGLTIGRDSPAIGSDFFVALETRELDTRGEKRTFVQALSRIEREWLDEYFPERIATRTAVEFVGATGRVSTFQMECYEDLPLEEPRPAPALADAALPLLINAVHEKWDQIVREQQDVEQWLARLEFLRQHMPEMDWPMIDDARVRSIAELACYGETDLARVLAKSWTSFLDGALSEPQRRTLKREAPPEIEVPTGRALPIQYSQEQGAVLAVRLQELFGWRESPKLVAGRVSLTLSLLGPNFRPVQITRDLKSFWENGYQDVRKELRARYPKHSWPQDPWTARPEAKGRRK